MSNDEESKYKASWADRAWFAGGCATLLVSLYKAVKAVSAAPENPLMWLKVATVALAGYLLADLGSGIYHWAVDNYGSAEIPIFGAQIESFRAHHQSPTEITKVETAGILSILAAAVTVALLPVNLFSGDPVLLVFFVSFGGCGMFSLKFHAWAHTPKKRLPRAVAALQDVGILLPSRRHSAHHRPPFNSNYCTVCGVLDMVLDKCNVLAAMELVIFRCTGVRPRSWSEPIAVWTPQN